MPTSEEPGTKNAVSRKNMDLDAAKGYFQAVREVCDKYGALLVLDKIMCGMGRGGTMHVWEQEGIRGPDTQTVAKSLGGGFTPLSAVLIHQDIFDVVAKTSGSLAGGHSRLSTSLKAVFANQNFMKAHPVPCASALAVQKVVARDNLISNVQKMDLLLETLLKEQIAPLPLVGNIRGRGLLWAVEFMLDRDTKTLFPLDDDFSCKVKGAALDVGLNVLSHMGFAGMHKIDTAAVTPPFIVTVSKIVQIVELFKTAIEKASELYLRDRS